MPARWQLRQLFQANGSHLPKREKASLYSSQFEQNWGRHQNCRNLSADEPLPGNLPKDQYRYFQGCRAGIATFSKCRTCGEAFTTHEARVRHVKDSGCMRVFNDAITVWIGKTRRYTIILEPCAVCNISTLHRKWGIPLCMDVKCYEKWMFDIIVPPDLKIVIMGIKGA